MSEEKNLDGLKGWLILVGLGVIIAPFSIGFTIFPFYYEIFTQNTWEKLTSPESPHYHPLWQTILITELAINIALILIWCVIAFLFFAKKKKFPILYICMTLFSPVFILADSLAITLVMPEEPVLDPETLDNLARSIVPALIWVPYMLVSKRVKATFTR
ncbi:MAG: DUF2569 domain-containing protein [Alphaproteobacteria bacterium]|nr:DUF2569 domain-containing protein [Alphaproteobacteria bacterium]